MLFPFFLQSSERSAAWLIGGGLVLIAAAQFFERVPLASAIAMIAWGVLQLLQAKGAAALTVAIHFVVYTMLIAFTIASQSHAALTAHEGKMTLPLLLDQALAITLLVGLLLNSCGSEATEDA